MKIPPKIFFFCKHFGTGVLIATAFVHVSTKSPISTHYLTFLASSNCLSVSQRSMSSRPVYRQISCHAWCHHDGIALHPFCGRNVA
jgi:hypothetical protein